MHKTTSTCLQSGDICWSYAMRFAAEMLRHKALGFPWHGHDKKQAKSAYYKGAIGRLIAIDPWGNGNVFLLPRGQTSKIWNLLQLWIVYVYPSLWLRQRRINGKPYQPLQEKTYGFTWILETHNTLHHSLQRLRVLHRLLTMMRNRHFGEKSLNQTMM